MGLADGFQGVRSEAVVRIAELACHNDRAVLDDFLIGHRSFAVALLFRGKIDNDQSGDLTITGTTGTLDLDTAYKLGWTVIIGSAVLTVLTAAYMLIWG